MKIIFWKKELQEILKQYKVWLETGEKEGKRADFDGMILIWTNLARTDLRRANLRNAIFVCANFTKANLIGADMSNVNLYLTNFSFADLSGAVLEGAKFNKWTSLKNANLFCAYRPEGLKGYKINEDGFIIIDLN